jgi:tetratricopeptide (TPR) repeat protein
MRRPAMLARVVTGLAALVLGLAPAPRAFAHDGLHDQIEQVTRRIAETPGDGALYLKRGELYRLHGEWDRALADLDRASRLAPGLAAVEFARGRTLLEAGRPAEARAALDRFLAHAPAHVEALLTRARARAALGEHAGAAADYTRALELMPRPEPDVYLERARALAAADRVEEAVRGLDEGIARLGPLVTLELCAVDLERRLGRVDAALARVDLLASRSPRKETWLARRGEILDAAGRADEARAAFAAALDAIRALPADRRTRAVVELERQLRDRLSVETKTGHR